MTSCSMPVTAVGLDDISLAEPISVLPYILGGYFVFDVLQQPTFRRVKEGSTVRPKGTTLERAIRDLEKIVAECKS